MNIEQRVRRIVADHFVGKVEQTASSNPNLNKVIEKAVEKNIEKKLDEFAVDPKKDMDIERAYKAQEEIFSNLRDFDYVEAYLSDIKDCWLESKESYEKEYQAFLDGITMVGKMMGVNVRDSFVSANDDVLNYLQRRDNVIFSLVKEAEKNGLEAVNEEAINTAIRKEHPTAEDYIQSFKSLITASIELVYAWSNFNVMARETTEVYAYCVGEILADTFLNNDVEVIYDE